MSDLRGSGLGDQLVAALLREPSVFPAAAAYTSPVKHAAVLLFQERHHPASGRIGLASAATRLWKASGDSSGPPVPHTAVDGRGSRQIRLAGSSETDENDRHPRRQDIMLWMRLKTFVTRHGPSKCIRRFKIPRQNDKHAKLDWGGTKMR
jgi:hypothetical protein